MTITGANINEEMQNRTVAKISGGRMDRTTRAATNEKPHIKDTMIAAIVPCKGDRTKDHYRNAIRDVTGSHCEALSNYFWSPVMTRNDLPLSLL